MKGSGASARSNEPETMRGAVKPPGVARVVVQPPAKAADAGKASPRAAATATKARSRPIANPAGGARTAPKPVAGPRPLAAAEAATPSKSATSATRVGKHPAPVQPAPAKPAPSRPASAKPTPSRAAAVMPPRDKPAAAKPIDRARTAPETPARPQVATTKISAKAASEGPVAATTAVTAKAAPANRPASKAARTDVTETWATPALPEIKVTPLPLPPRPTAVAPAPLATFPETALAAPAPSKAAAAPLPEPAPDPVPVRPAPPPAVAAPPPASEARVMSHGMNGRPPVISRNSGKDETFAEGDHVVYPTHGVGRVEKIAREEIAGHQLELIHITFEENRMTLRVPVDKARTAGLRKLATRKLFDEALAVLRGRARIKRTMWSRRAQEYEAKINSGDPLAIAEVVRDLHRNAGQPDQSFSERQIYEAAMDRLAAELGALDETDKNTATTKLTNFLKTVV